MHLLLLVQGLHPAPAAPDHPSSIAGWVWLAVAMALVLACGLVLASRR